MPTYVFTCSTCGATTEEVQRMSETTDTIACPNCEGVANKVIGVPNFHLKGVGWTVPEHEKIDRKNGRKKRDDEYKGSVRAKEQEADGA